MLSGPEARSEGVSLFDRMERWNGMMEWNGMTTPTECTMTTYIPTVFVTFNQETEQLCKPVLSEGRQEKCGSKFVRKWGLQALKFKSQY